MKDLIEKKLEEHGRNVIAKDSLSMDDINFLIYLLNRIEMKENKLWREKMNTMLDAVGR